MTCTQRVEANTQNEKQGETVRETDSPTETWRSALTEAAFERDIYKAWIDVGLAEDHLGVAAAAMAAAVRPKLQE